MSKKINRTGETTYNKFGSLMVINNYISNSNINVYFPEYDWMKFKASYDSFKKGSIKCPYEPRVYGVGYIGEGIYRSSEGGTHTKIYLTWKNMLNRCYSNKTHLNSPTYEDCFVVDEWLNFQNFAQWYEENYYEVYNENMALDKDILYKGNRIYSPETCVFVPQKINNLLVKSNNLRGELPIGVCNYNDDKFISYCSDGNGNCVCLGIFETSLEAFQSYKIYKESIIKMIADEYKNMIPYNLYMSLQEYQVEIHD